MSNSALVTALATSGALSLGLATFLRDRGAALGQWLGKRIDKIAGRSLGRANKRTIERVISGHPSGHVSITIETHDRNVVISLSDLLRESDAIELFKRAITSIEPGDSSRSSRDSGEPR